MARPRGPRHPRRDHGSPQQPPAKMHLRALAEQWAVKYESDPSLKVGSPASNQRPAVELSEVGPNQLLVSGHVGQIGLCHGVLRLWLTAKAKAHLTPWLHQLAAEQGFTFERVQVRCQKTRWGSCSTRGTISLNLKLLFLPPELVEHILIHELCHTVHMNHSAAFWQLVNQHEPEMAARRGAMAMAHKYVPHWLSPR